METMTRPPYCSSSFELKNRLCHCKSDEQGLQNEAYDDSMTEIESRDRPPVHIDLSCTLASKVQYSPVRSVL